MRLREETNVLVAIEDDDIEIGVLKYSYSDTCWKFSAYIRDGLTQKQMKRISKELKRLNGLD